MNKTRNESELVVPFQEIDLDELYNATGTVNVESIRDLLKQSERKMVVITFVTDAFTPFDKTRGIEVTPINIDRPIDIYVTPDMDIDEIVKSVAKQLEEQGLQVAQVFEIHEYDNMLIFVLS